ncbi:LysR substrate-binding domain-containing protein [Phenylobacterium sp.]|jgi:LysR family glycine cleavage system transcriptional activator|uniref:LysR substrate-binding domain-containing protein n=1 Tax=Phenylobacterium sp. TaxID=1871053 RepID=UPI0037840FB7
MDAKRAPLPPYAALRAFDAYGRAGGVRRAAQALGVTHAVVSRHLHTLEAWFGLMLIDRENGGLTAAGREYHARVAYALDELGGATDALMRLQGSRLEVWCAPGFAYLWLTSRLRTFSSLHPAVALDLRPTDASPAIEHHQADADIRFAADGARRPVGTQVRIAEIARPFVFPVASPKLAAAVTDRVHQPADLLALPLLHEESDLEWRLWFERQAVAGPLKPPAARLWQAHISLGAAREGQGIALTNYYLAAEDLSEGRLVPIGRGNAAFRAVRLGAYTLAARAEAWERGNFAKFRQWLSEPLAVTAQEEAALIRESGWTA